ncbi:mannose-1-phosphate guanylyltransferase/mannose-6-phosphate isomerase [Symbiopectobacterium purcellii]|uniref:mannose-1-phosphate guanylyltransferase/mannose-6-phosphate isomerase n=1 Tax=Symbiopectobacterium purcellii TaxID=2871826 RepID=UPI003F85171A
MLLPIIMAGGSGTRLWPLSRELFPKQFLSLAGHETMLQQTINRLTDIEHLDPVIICNENHRFIVAEQLRNLNIKSNGILLEPIAKNTAPALALAALHTLTIDEDPTLLVLAADHVIDNMDAFTEAVNQAKSLADDNKLVTFGIIPDYPHTGYGYIKRGDKIFGGYSVISFVEKPDIDTAVNYLNSGHYYWNSGIFIMKASVYISELIKYNYDIYISCRDALAQARTDLDFIRVDPDVFSKCPEDSIDYAVMEKTDLGIVVPLDAQWSDVGSWSALWDISAKDENANTLCGDVITENTLNSYIHSDTRLVAAIGLDGVVIIDTKDAILIADKKEVQKVKNIVNILKDKNRIEYLQHREVFRPWGSHDTIAEGKGFQVKYVMLYPGKKTAKQVHYHRTEHWVVVSGTAKISYDDKVYIVAQNESTYIPSGVEHSIENPGKLPLEIIEIRSGSYLEEDDIVRMPNDVYSKCF